MHRVEGVGAPGKGAVAVDQDGGDLGGVDVPGAEGLDDDVARLQLVLAGDLLRGHLPGAGNLPVEVVPLGGAHGGHALARLGEGGGPAAVGVDDAPQGGEGVVEGQVGIGVAGGLPLALHPLAGLQAHHHHVLGGHVVILHPRGLDDHQALLPVHAGYVAPGKGDQAVLGQQEVGLTDLLFQFFQHCRTHPFSNQMGRKAPPPEARRGRRTYIPFSFQARSLRKSCCSRPSTVVSLVMWTNSMSIMLAQSFICSAVTS